MRFKVDAKYGKEKTIIYVYKQITGEPNDKLNIINAITYKIEYDYKSGSLYINFHNMPKYVINLNLSIGEILQYKNNEWILSFLNTHEIKVIFCKIIFVISEKINDKEYGEKYIQEQCNKLNQILYLLKINYQR